MNDTPGNGGNGSPGPGIGERVDHMGHDVQHMFDDARAAVDQLTGKLDLGGRVRRNPYGTLLAAAGIGYVLGGGLFTPLTARMVRLAVKLAALPFVKDELMGMAEAAVDGFVQNARAHAPAQPPGGSGEPPTDVL